jgi:hypothetical protein
MGDPIYPVPQSLTESQKEEEMEQSDKEMEQSDKKKTCPRIDNPTKEQVEELMARYVDALERLFEQYKVQAGYPNDVLEIL